MTDFQRISIAQARQLLAAQDAIVADIRDPQSFALGHMPDAFHLTDANLHQFVLEKDTSKPLIVVCYHGISSQGAARYLIEQGFSEVYSLEGGFTAWQQEQPDQVARG